MSLASLRHRFAAHKRLGITLGVLVAIFILFGLLAYFWLPGYAKAKLEMALSEALHRPVTVQSIEIQPYTLELTIHAFRVGERPGTADAENAVLSVDKLYVNLSIASIAHLAPVISSVSIYRPTLRLVREGENQFNITDLIEDFLKQPKDETPTLFSVSNVVVEGGRFEFVDRLKKSQQEISDINIGVPFIANLESAEETWVEPHFSAKVNGAPLLIEGKARPFAENRQATLELELSGIDLTRLDEYSPIPVGVKLNSGFFDSKLLLTFNQTPGQPPNLVLTGRAVLRKLEIENRATEAPYSARLGQLDVELTEVNLNAVKPSQGTLVLTEATIARIGDTEPAMSLPQLRVDDVTVDPKRQSLSVGSLVLERVKASIRRESDGRLDLAKLFAPTPGTEPAPEAAAPHAEASKPWSVKLGSLKIIAAVLGFEDSTLSNVPSMVADPLDLTISDIDLSGAQPLKLELKAEINQEGHLQTSGSLAWAPLMADLAVDAKDINFVPLQGWAGDRLNALITRGALSFQGNVKAEGVNGAAAKVVLNGDGRLSHFNALDKSDMTELMRWRSLDISRMEFSSEPLRVNIESVALADFFAHVTLSPDGQLNLKRLIRRDNANVPPAPSAAMTPPEQTKSSTFSSQPGVARAPVPARKDTPVQIGRITLQGGHVNFHDEFIKPNYRARLTGLSGRIGPLDPRKPGEIDIRGAVDKTAPLKIVGKMDTFGSELFLDIKATAKGIDMPTFSPYSGKYVGYTIEKGKLSVDIHYHIEKGELRAENNVFLDQLTLGEKIESPDALSIPVKLALAVLKNSEGEIDVHLPISGSINDPQFSLGGVIVNAIINLLTKAVTAPFTVLGSLFGGEELSEIGFAPGDATITAEAENRLKTLSKALTDRSSLELEITGRADPAHDREALKHRMLERKVKVQKLAEQVKKGQTTGDIDEIELTPDEYPKYLTLAYKEAKFAKPKNLVGLTKSLPVPEMEQLLLANVNADDNEMRELAEQRAAAALNWFVEHGGIPGERIFVLEPKVEVEPDEKKVGSKVEFSLR
ncbi:DUF748 domain-containing protein [Nitrosospira sp. Is2]|uniref:DUF748 domain-containing protein n=1 Tax=Nitrosospira sp. Is2 TaxID=3080532 RepID=UPI00295342E7|nr:DUF748 domain-containing protein [Nitrosospira sp. Is2]WON75187.1 DUF748 domain-containing protein [Nitrosospira sp. Is2]